MPCREEVRALGQPPKASVSSLVTGGDAVCTEVICPNDKVLGWQSWGLNLGAPGLCAQLP